MRKATDFFQRSIDKDPGYAPAWEWISASKRAESSELQREAATYPSKRDTVRRLVQESRRAVERALALDPQLSGAHSTLASLLFDNRDWTNGEAQVRRALELDPNNPHALAWAGDLAVARGQLDAAITIYRKAASIDPVNPNRHSELAAALSFAGKYPEAMEEVHAITALSPRIGEHRWVGQLLRLQGNYAAALKEFDQESAAERQTNVDRVMVYDALRRKAEADTLLASIEKDHPENDPYDIACAYATRGDIDESLRWLRRAYKLSPADVWSARVDPDLKNIRSDPRFEAMWSELNLPR